MTPNYDHDTQVADLAFLFLTDSDTRHPDAREHAKRINSLADAIQHTVEDWIDSHPIVEVGSDARSRIES